MNKCQIVMIWSRRRRRTATTTTTTTVTRELDKSKLNQKEDVASSDWTYLGTFRWHHLYAEIISFTGQHWTEWKAKHKKLLIKSQQLMAAPRDEKRIEKLVHALSWCFSLLQNYLCSTNSCKEKYHNQT